MTESQPRQPPMCSAIYGRRHSCALAIKLRRTGASTSHSRYDLDKHITLGRHYILLR